MRPAYLRYLKRESARYALKQLASTLAVEAIRPEMEIEALCQFALAFLVDVRDLKPDEALVKRRVYDTQRRRR